MAYTVYVNILPREEILDPQGKATQRALAHLGYQAIDTVRVGKRIRLSIAASSSEEALKLADEAASKLLANKLTEAYQLELEQGQLA